MYVKYISISIRTCTSEIDLDIKILCSRQSEKERNSYWQQRGTFEKIYKGSRKLCNTKKVSYLSNYLVNSGRCHFKISLPIFPSMVLLCLQTVRWEAVYSTSNTPLEKVIGHLRQGLPCHRTNYPVRVVVPHPTKRKKTQRGISRYIQSRKKCCIMKKAATTFLTMVVVRHQQYLTRFLRSLDQYLLPKYLQDLPILLESQSMPE